MKKKKKQMQEEVAPEFTYDLNPVECLSNELFVFFHRDFLGSKQHFSD